MKTKKELIQFINNKINDYYFMYRKILIGKRTNDSLNKLEKIKNKIKELSLKKVFFEKMNLTEKEINNIYRDIDNNDELLYQ